MLNEDLGFSIKLSHHPQETTWEEHGFVKIFIEGTVVAESDAVQHNRSYSTRSQTFETMIENVVKAASRASRSEIDLKGAELDQPSNAEQDAGEPVVATAAVTSTAEPLAPTGDTALDACMLPVKPQ